MMIKKEIGVRFILAISFLLLLLIIHFFKINHIISVPYLQLQMAFLEKYVVTHYIQSIFYFIVIIAAAQLFFIPITVLLSLISGILFGVFYGTLIILIGVILGSVTVFLLVRYFLYDSAQRFLSKRFAQFNTSLRLYGARYLLILQLLPGTPTFFINIFSAISLISLWTFFWTLTVGMIPQTIFYTSIAYKFYDISSIDDLFNVGPFVVLLILLLIFIMLPNIKKWILNKSTKN